MRTALRSLLGLFAFGAFVVSIDPPAQARTPAVAGYEPGTVIVKTSARRLYFVLENGEVITYPVG
jgi:lipoprotein-anchoring transpeptidase ErfK/SrfK